MDWTSIIIALFGIAGTIAGIYLTQRESKKRELELKKAEWRKEFREKNIYSPLLRYVDNSLEFANIPFL